MDASDANEDGEDIATRSDTFSSIQASTDLVELDEEEHEYNNFEDDEEFVEPHTKASSKPSEDIFELDQHSDNNIVADIMLNSAQDNAEQNVSHSWPYFLSPYQAITYTYIKEF